MSIREQECGQRVKLISVKFVHSAPHYALDEVFSYLKAILYSSLSRTTRVAAWLVHDTLAKKNRC